MSSSQPFASSPFSPRTRRRRSRFTYKTLKHLSQSSTTCPLRVIAHIDLDAFYAQCEMVRLGVDADQPLAVQQWQGLIAINYPARAYGLSRHVTITEAKEKCPDIICQHVATWKEGDAKWSYSEDAWKEIATRKVSLDPYRVESRRILACIKATLPADKQKVEKASVDEVFLDLSAHVHSILLDRYSELQGPPPYDDPTEPLPKPPSTVLDWAADALVDLDSSHSEEDDPDWDDVVMLIASEIVRDVRAQVFKQLKYTCSAGISRNKMLAKLGSGYKKPNSQTVIRNRAVQHFLSGFKFTKIRNLGGKLGDEVVAAFNTDTVSDLLQIPVEQLKKQLGDDTGSWLHSIIRGEDNSEVSPRTQIKSMLSAKSFRPSISSMDVASKWLRIFVADIFGRLVEEGVLENKRRPKTINLHHRQGAQTRSKQVPIPSGRIITEDVLYDLAKNLLAQVIVDGRAWPCANLSLSVGGFEDGVTGNKGIGGFLVRGDEAKAMNTATCRREGTAGSGPARKKRRIKIGGIPTFFAQRTDSSHDEPEDEDANDTPPIHSEIEEYGHHQDGNDVYEDSLTALPISAQQRYDPDPDPDPNPSLAPPSAQRPPSTPPTSDAGEVAVPPFNDDDNDKTSAYTCKRCKMHLLQCDRTEHEDFHFAQDLQNEQLSPASPPPKSVPLAKLSSTKSKAKGRGRPAATIGAPEKGQKKLAFG